MENSISFVIDLPILLIQKPTIPKVNINVMIWTLILWHFQVYANCQCHNLIWCTRKCVFGRLILHDSSKNDVNMCTRHWEKLMLKITPRLWPLTLWCDLDISSRSRNLTLLDVAYCIYLRTRYDVYGFNT